MDIAKLLFVWLIIMVTLLGGFSVIFSITVTPEERPQLHEMGELLFKIGRGFIYFILTAAILSLALLGAQLLYTALISA